MCQSFKLQRNKNFIQCLNLFLSKILPRMVIYFNIGLIYQSKFVETVYILNNDTLDEDQKCNNAALTKWVLLYMSLLLCLWARQFYCKESLHPPDHPMTAAMLKDMIKGTFYPCMYV